MMQSIVEAASLSVPRKLYVGYERYVEHPSATVVLLHGLGCTHEVWEPLKPKLPHTVNVISLDLLGFGDSPKPAFSAYSNVVQAQSIIRTLRKLSVTEDLIIIGHSMGSLVAIELAKKKPSWIRHMFLCGPPIYRPRAEDSQYQDQEKILKKLYSLTAMTFEDNSKAVVEAAAVLKGLGLTPRSIELTSETIKPYIASLRTSILQQNTYTSAQTVTVPTAFYYGRFDPLVIHDNIVNIAHNNPHITTKRFLSSHELSGSYLRRIAKEVHRLMA